MQEVFKVYSGLFLELSRLEIFSNKLLNFFTDYFKNNRSWNALLEIWEKQYISKIEIKIKEPLNESQFF